MNVKLILQSLVTLAVMSSCSPLSSTPTAVINPVMLRQNASVQAMQAQANQRADQRFVRSSMGVITDQQTGLQWLEGPDLPTSWEMANDWAKTLGQGWRLPTTEELSGIYLKNSQRRGKYNDPLCLDETFTRNSGYSLWSTQRSSNSAWMYDFSRGYYHWTEISVKGHFDRAVAVRERQAQLELPF